MMLPDENQPTYIGEFNYHLPDERIAKRPLEERDSSKLLVWDKGEISRSLFSRISEFLPDNALLICNNTRVIQARIVFQKPTGARVELFCLEPVSPSDYVLSLSSKGSCEWKCMIGNLKKWKRGALCRALNFEGRQLDFSAELMETAENVHRVKFRWNDDTVSFSEILTHIGELPIPPYLHRKTEENDKKAYQTVYSKIEGSVAAPTAGLHFTPRVFDLLKKKNIVVEELTLHVGAGTFQPVKSETVEQHTMHSETFVLHIDTLKKIRDHIGNIVAVGTTSVRTLESLYYIGCKPIRASDDFFKVDQWEPYENAGNELSIGQSLQNIIDRMEKNRQTLLRGETRILIKPGFRFRVVDALITNFHQPKSTLLLLVSAFVNGDWKTIYNYAMNNDFRFLSYGDSSLLIR